MRSPGVLCGVLRHLAPVHRCARSVCCAAGCVCGAWLRGAHSSIRTVALRSRQGLGTLRAGGGGPEGGLPLVQRAMVALVMPVVRVSQVMDRVTVLLVMSMEEEDEEEDLRPSPCWPHD